MVLRPSLDGLETILGAVFPIPPRGMGVVFFISYFDLGVGRLKQPANLEYVAKKLSQ
jgi:hypothetical protein